MVAYCSGYRDYDIVILVHWSTVHWQCYCYIYSIVGCANVLQAMWFGGPQCGGQCKHTSDFVV